MWQDILHRTNAGLVVVGHGPRRLSKQLHTSVWAFVDHLDRGSPSRGGSTVGQIYDRPARLAFDRRVGRIDEAVEPGRRPMVSPRQAPIGRHALLNHDPLTVGRHDETMQIDLKAILHGRAVDLGDQLRRFRQVVPIEAPSRTGHDELARRRTTVTTSTTTHFEA